MGTGRALQLGVTPQQAVSLSISPLTGTHRGTEHRAIGRVASLVGDVVDRLHAADLAALREVVDACNHALEACLETQRDAERDASPAAVGDELTRLVALLAQVDGLDAPIVMRMIRRVLGRLDRRD